MKPEESVLRSVISSDNLEMLKYLITKKLIEPKTTTVDNSNILNYAAENNALKVLTYLIEIEKMDPYAYDTKNENVLHKAAGSTRNTLDLIKYLIEQKKMDVNVQAISSLDTPLHKAILWGVKDVVKYLIDAGAKKDMQNYYKETPLDEVSAGNNDLEKVIYLIETLKINPNKANVLGKTLLHYVAQSNGNDATDVIKYLLQHGAKKDIKDSEGKLPYDYATNQKVKDLLQ